MSEHKKEDIFNLIDRMKVIDSVHINAQKSVYISGFTDIGDQEPVNQESTRINAKQIIDSFIEITDAEVHVYSVCLLRNDPAQRIVCGQCPTRVCKERNCAYLKPMTTLKIRGKHAGN